MSEQLEIRLLRIHPSSIRWQPLPDISAFELAQAVPMLILLWRGTGDYKIIGPYLSKLPPEVQRHFGYEYE